MYHMVSGSFAFGWLSVGAHASFGVDRAEDAIDVDPGTVGTARDVVEFESSSTV